jgi:hypothetical protein
LLLLLGLDFICSHRLNSNPWTAAVPTAAAATPPLSHGNSHRLCCRATNTQPAVAAPPPWPAEPLAEAPELTWQQEVFRAAADSGQLIKMSLKGRITGSMPYKMVNVRPVLLKGSRRLQFSHLDAKQVAKASAFIAHTHAVASADSISVTRGNSVPGTA